MEKNTKSPSILLSIGMIFRNEIRCLERCLKSLQPLREAIPCELVMADTGSDDGSREIAEQYADIIFDFPWIKDFSAARNAVLDRCSGQWHLTIDSDEWLEDITPLVNFLTSKEAYQWVSLSICQRNYTKGNFIGNYEDLPVARLFQLRTEIISSVRYVGAIHELPQLKVSATRVSVNRERLMNMDIILHHDGYIYKDRAEQKAKLDRNMELLEAQLTEDTRDTRLLTECVESSRDSEEALNYAKRLISVLQDKNYMYPQQVPNAYRQVIVAAIVSEKYDLARQWLAEGLDALPDSFLLRIDGNCYLYACTNKKDTLQESLSYGLAWREAVLEYNAGKKEIMQSLIITPTCCSPQQQFVLTCSLLDTACKIEEWETAALLIQDLTSLEATDNKDAIGLLFQTVFCHADHVAGGAACIRAHWDRALAYIDSKDEKKQNLGRNVIRLILTTSTEQLDRRKQTDDKTQETENQRQAVLQLLVDTGDCDLGYSARVLQSDSADRIYEELCHINKWEYISMLVLAHALQCRAVLPDSFYQLPSETLAQIASGIAPRDECFSKTILTVCENEAQTLPELLWQTNLAAAAMFQADWSSDEEGERLCNLFARLEKTLTSYLYRFENISEEILNILPPLHRFGWCLLRGREALEENHLKEYIRLLRRGLQEMPDMFKAVEFMLDHAEQHIKRRPAVAPPELLQLAEQVRAILAQYPPDYPAVLEIKKSPVYQRVAYLIEDPAAPPIAGMKQ